MGPTVASHIECKPSVCGGKPCIAGTRIRVQDIYDWHEREGFSPDEIVTKFPQLTLADVYAALSYYWDHREAIERERREDRDLVEAMKASIPSKLVQKISARDAGDAPIPPR
jgi:uncharacterized protein (DUF433 family)